MVKPDYNETYQVIENYIILTPLFTLSKIDTDITSKALSKKKAPPVTATAKVDVFLKTLRFNVAQSDILMIFRESDSDSF